MDLAPAAESADPVNAREKRKAAAEEEDGDFGDRRKRMRNGGANEAEMRRIAEIVLVLSAMGTMRGGKNPTAPEKAMMAEARAIAVSICEELAPKDIVPREAFGGIIEDLGLNRLEEQRLGLRPKQSIVEKMESSKRRMEESKSFAAQAAVDTIQRAQAVGENRGAPTAVHTFSSDKASHMQASAGTFQHNSQTGHVSSASSTILYFQPSNAQVRAPLGSTGMPNTNLGRDSSSTTSRVDIPHLGSDGRVNGSFQAPNLPTGYTVKTTATLQPQSIPSSNISTKIEPPEYPSVKTEGNPNLHVLPLKSQATNVPAFTQVLPGTVPSMHHPIQGTQFVHAAHHIEISKIVQKLLHPKPAEHPTWSPPSKDYMSKSVACQTCKYAIKEVDNMFVCDACEKGFHSKCLQSTNQKFVPRGEWYCPRCMTISGGKPFPPKYGRVTRNLVANNITSSRAGLQSPPEERVEAQDQNVYQQKIVLEGEPDVSHGSLGGLTDVSTEAKTMQTNKINESEVSAVLKKEETPASQNCPDKNPRSLEASCVPSYAGPLENGPTRYVEKPEASDHEDKVETEAKDCTSTHPSGSAASKDLHPLSSHSLVHDTEAVSAGLFPEQKIDSGQFDNHTEKCDATKTDDGIPTCNLKQDDQDAEHEKEIRTAGISNELQDTAKGSRVMHHVDWIGDLHEVLEDRKFYESCQINGVAMWEDSQTGSRWVAVNRCYFPGDLPATVGHPSAPESNEVYESNDEITLMAGLIEGPCIILPAKKFGETDQRDDQQSDEGRPVFLCRWFYDKIKGVFRPVPS
ncbi:hypothetical protein V2J09_014015 [Rumex salicifolius]